MKNTHFIFKMSIIMAGLVSSLTGCLTVQLPKIQIKPNAEPKNLEWKNIATEALQNNPDLKVARFNINSSARSRDIALGDYLPSVSGVLDRHLARTTTTLSKDSLGLDVLATTSLFNGFQTTGNVLKTKKDLEAAKWAYLDSSATVRFRLRSAYIELLRLKKLLDVSRKIETRRRRNAELIQLRYQAGKEHLGSSLRAQAIAGQAAFEVRQILRKIESVSLRLGREMGGEFELPVQAAGDLDQMIPKLPDQVPDYSSLAEHTPRVKKAVKTAESFKAAVVSAQGSVWPKVDGTADYGYLGGQASSLRDESSVGFKVSAPFFNGGKNIGAIRKAKADYEAARETARSTRDETLVQLSEAWTQFADAVELVDVRMKFLEAARKRSEIVRAEYETGLVNFQDFDIVEQDIADSEKNYVESLASVLVQQANWELVKGSTLEDTLREG